MDNMKEIYQHLRATQPVDQHKEFFGSLWSYTLSLENQIVSLRHLANAYAGEMGLREPFPQPEEGFKERFFFDMPAFDDVQDEFACQQALFDDEFC